LEFEWDETKAASNLVKHDLSFSDAIQVFYDPSHVVMDATREVNEEIRLKAIGMLGQGLVTVIFTNRAGKIRLISARRCNKPEERIYGDR
jgi:uncharacterized protein